MHDKLQYMAKYSTSLLCVYVCGEGEEEGMSDCTQNIKGYKIILKFKFTHTQKSATIHSL
jgi:hypothetical protein